MSRSFMDLPADVRRKILSELDEPELVRSRLVSRQLSTDVRGHNHWVYMISQEFGLSPDEIKEYRKNRDPYDYYILLKKQTATDPDSLLDRGIKTNRYDLVKIAVRKGAKFAHQNYIHDALLYPIRGKNIKMVKLLLELGSPVTRRNIDDAITAGDPEILALLSGQGNIINRSF